MPDLDRGRGRESAHGQKQDWCEALIGHIKIRDEPWIIAVYNHRTPLGVFSKSEQLKMSVSYGVQLNLILKLNVHIYPLMPTCNCIHMYMLLFVSQVMEIAPFEDSVDRVGGAQELIDAVNQLQNYGMVKQQLNKGCVN